MQYGCVVNCIHLHTLGFEISLETTVIIIKTLVIYCTF